MRRWGWQVEGGVDEQLDVCICVWVCTWVHVCMRCVHVMCVRLHPFHHLQSQQSSIHEPLLSSSRCFLPEPHGSTLSQAVEAPGLGGVKWMPRAAGPRTPTWGN